MSLLRLHLLVLLPSLHSVVHLSLSGLGDLTFGVIAGAQLYGVQRILWWEVLVLLWRGYPVTELAGGAAQLGVACAWPSLPSVVHS